jgi:hypothetical protein
MSSCVLAFCAEVNFVMRTGVTQVNLSQNGRQKGRNGPLHLRGGAERRALAQRRDRQPQPSLRVSLLAELLQDEMCPLLRDRERADQVREVGPHHPAGARVPILDIIYFVTRTGVTSVNLSQNGPRAR